MIIIGLLKLVKGLLSLLLVFNIPALPDSVQDVMVSVATFLGDGISVIRAFIGAEAMTVMATLLSIVIAVHAAYMLYTAVMWILKKIPMFGIS